MSDEYTPFWFRKMVEWPEMFNPVTVTYRRWLAGDESRNLPMPLRYAATHPQSPQAIIGVLSGGAR